MNTVIRWYLVVAVTLFVVVYVGVVAFTAWALGWHGREIRDYSDDPPTC